MEGALDGFVGNVTRDDIATSRERHWRTRKGKLRRLANRAIPELEQMHPANWKRGFQSFNEVNLWVMTRQRCYAGEVILPLQESYENPRLRVSCFEGCSPAHVSKQRNAISRIFLSIVSSHLMCARGRHFHYPCSLFQIGDGHLRTACIGHRASGTVHRTTLFLFLTLGTMTLGFDPGGLGTTHRVLLFSRWTSEDCQADL